MWQFDEHVIAENMDKGQYHIKAVWSKTSEENSTLTVKYLDNDLSEIMASHEIFDSVNDDYLIEVIDIEGYKFDHVLDNEALSGILEDGSMEISLIYNKVIENEIPVLPDDEDSEKDENVIIEDKEDLDKSEVDEEISNDSNSKVPSTGIANMSFNYLLIILMSSTLLAIIYYNP